MKKGDGNVNGRLDKPAVKFDRGFLIVLSRTVVFD